MRAYPEGRGLHEADLSADLGRVDALDLYYLQDAALLYRSKGGYLKLSAAGMDAAETNTTPHFRG